MTSTTELVPDDGDDDLALIDAAAALTDKQRRWADAMMGEAKMNPWSAVKMAGYEDGTAVGMTAYKNLRHPRIREYLRLVMRAQAKDMLVSRARVTQELSAVAYSDLSEILDIDGRGQVTLKAASLAELPEQVRVSVRKLTVSEDADGNPKIILEMHDKLKALDLLAKLGVEPLEDEDKDLTHFTGLEIIAPSGEQT